MTVIEHIFKELGEATAIAVETGDPVQTVHSWKAKGNIPRWRRASLLDVARRKGKELSADAILYLTSTDKLPQQDDPEQASAKAA